MRKLLICVVAALLAGCMSPSGPKIGEVSMVTDAKGQLAKVYMSMSTGSAAMDRRAMQFARTTFVRRVLDPLPNHTYFHAVTGKVTEFPGDVTVKKIGKQ